MKQVQRVLMLEFWIPVAISLVMVALFEAGILEKGLLATDKSSEFVLASVMELLTLCCIPLSLFLLRIKRVGRWLHKDEVEGRYLTLATIRLDMLCVPMMANTLLYYLYMFVGFAYLAIILLLTLFFVYPSMARCVDETDSSNS